MVIFNMQKQLQNSVCSKLYFGWGWWGRGRSRPRFFLAFKVDTLTPHFDSSRPAVPAGSRAPRHPPHSPHSPTAPGLARRGAPTGGTARGRRARPPRYLRSGVPPTTPGRDNKHNNVNIDNPKIFTLSHWRSSKRYVGPMEWRGVPTDD